jgi:hypothetical protein
LNSELLKPLIARVIDIMRQKNLVPPNMPEELREANVEVFFSSQIARAQRASEVHTLDMFMGSLGAYAEFDPAVVNLVDPKKYAHLRAELQGVPQEIFRPPEELAELEQAQQEQAQAQQQQEAQLNEAEVANKSAPLIQG